MCIYDDDDLPRVDRGSYISASMSALTSYFRGHHVIQYSTLLVQLSCILVTWLCGFVALWLLWLVVTLIIHAVLLY